MVNHSPSVLISAEIEYSLFLRFDVIFILTKTRMFHQSFKQSQTKQTALFVFLDSKFKILEKSNPKLRMLQLWPPWLESCQLWAICCVWILEFVSSLEQLQFWFKISKILDLRNWNINKTADSDKELFEETVKHPKLIHKFKTKSYLPLYFLSMTFQQLK